MTSLEENVRGVLYGAIYSTFLTQAIKSVIILFMNLAFHVPLAGVLAILSFIIGFFRSSARGASMCRSLVGSQSSATRRDRPSSCW